MKKRNLELKYGAFLFLGCLVFGLVLLLMITLLQSLFLNELESGDFSLYGDLNHDGIVNYLDGDFMSQQLKEITSNGGNLQETELLDFNHDSRIDNADTLYYYAYYESEYFEHILFEDFVNMINQKRWCFMSKIRNVLVASLLLSWLLTGCGKQETSSVTVHYLDETVENSFFHQSETSDENQIPDTTQETFVLESLY